MSITEVKENNRVINKLISGFIEKRNGVSIITEKGELDSTVKEIFQREVDKLLTIYKLELQKYIPEENIKPYGTNEINVRDDISGDCRGGKKGIGISSDIEEFVKNQVYPFVKNTNLIQKSDLNQPIDYQYSGSKREQLDYYATLVNSNGTAIDWVWNVIPHETMHAFGIVGGNRFLKEGITEELTRQICEKYNIQMTPTSHTQEAEFIRKLMMIVGKDVVVRAGLYTEEPIEKRYEELSNVYETKLNLVPGSFMKLNYILENMYELTMKYKREDPFFYNKLFTQNWDEILTQEDREILGDTGVINSYKELIEPIESYISKNKEENIEYYDDIDYSEVLIMQQYEKDNISPKKKKYTKPEFNILARGTKDYNKVISHLKKEDREKFEKEEL